MSKILFVEDDKTTALVTQSRLEAIGHQVTVAYAGLEALELYDNSFELVLLDLGLPDINGCEVARHIRSQEQADRHVLIIALTLTGAAEAEEACRNARIDKHIEKPLDRAKLIAITEELAKRQNICST